MTKTKLSAALAALAVAAAPAVASAHGAGDGGHHHHRGKHHRHHGHRVEVRELAGTVASFDGTTLTITTRAGHTVSGTVTGKTILDCKTATTARAARHGGGDDPGGDHDAGDDETCAAGAIVAGVGVREAKLSLTGSGETWKKVELQL